VTSTSLQNCLKVFCQFVKSDDYFVGHQFGFNKNKTSSSAIAEGPRDALSQLKSC